MKFYRNPIFFLLVLLSLAVIPIFKPYVSGTADGLGHRFRLVSFYTSLREGNIRPRWSREAALGFGAPLFLFNYPLPYYLASLFLFLGFSVNTAGQLLAAFSLFGGGVGMYLLGKKLTGNTWGGLVAGVIYTYAPYHLQMTYLYDAWGEVLAFVFPPWILYFILSIISKQEGIPQEKVKGRVRKPVWSLGYVKRYLFPKPASLPLPLDVFSDFLLLVIVWFLFILSHNVSAVMISPVLLVFGLIATRLHPRKFFIIGNAFFLAVVISSFFWLPALILAKDMRYLDFIRTEAGLRGAFFKPLIPQITTAVKVMREGVTHYLDFTVGLPILFVGIIHLLILISGSCRSVLPSRARLQVFAARVLGAPPFTPPGSKERGNVNYLVTVLLVLLVLSLYLTQGISNWFWQFPPFTFILYPFRFLFLATFVGALLTGLVGAKNKAFAIGLILFATFQGNPYLSPYTDIFPFPDSYFYQKQTITSAPGTRKNMLVKEFLPVYARAGYLEKLEFSSDEMVEAYLAGNGGRIEIVSSNAEKLELKFSNVLDDALVINRFYFPNWDILLDGKETRVGKDEMGRITVDVPAGNHKVELIFGISEIEKLANLISFLGVIIWGGVLWKRWRSVYS